MLARFTKKADGRHRLTIVRDDGSVSQGQMVPGLGPDAVPHDLLHALVERTLGLSRGVYGMVDSGLEIGELIDPARKHMTNGQTGLMLSEVITTLLQGEAAYVGVDEGDFRDRLCQQCREHGIAVPAISDFQLRDVRALRDDYEVRWRQLQAEETLEVDIGFREPF